MPGRRPAGFERLLHCVDTMLEWARVDSGRFQLEPEPIEAHELIRVARDAVADQARSKGLDIEVNAGAEVPMIWSSLRLLRLIVINLLERAIRRTLEGTVIVSLTGDTERVCVRVHDGGPALSESERRMLFDALSPARDLQQSGGFGSGLELHIVADLVRAIGGEITHIEESDGNLVELAVPNADTGAVRSQS